MDSSKRPLWWAWQHIPWSKHVKIPRGCKTDKWIQLHAHPVSNRTYNTSFLKKPLQAVSVVCDRCYTFSWMHDPEVSTLEWHARQVAVYLPRHKVFARSKWATNVFSKSQGSSAILGPKEMAATIFHLRTLILKWHPPSTREIGNKQRQQIGSKIIPPGLEIPQAWSAYIR